MYCTYVCMYCTLCMQGGLVSRLLGLFQLMDEEPHFLYLWDRLGSKEAIKDFLLNIFHLFNELVTTDIYPDEWATMRIVANEILLKTLQVNTKFVKSHAKYRNLYTTWCAVSYRGF